MPKNTLNPIFFPPFMAENEMPKVIQNESIGKTTNYFPGTPSTQKECFKWCEDNNGGILHRQLCKTDCDIKVGTPYFPWFTEGKYSQESTVNDIKSTLQDIGDNFYSLAESVSVL